MRLVSRVSSRVFLGEEVCRNENWLRVTSNYTVDAFRAADELRLWPAPLRYIVVWFLPSCQRHRANIREASSIIDELVQKRRLQKQRGEKVEFEDAIEWYVTAAGSLRDSFYFSPLTRRGRFEREANGRKYDPTMLQLILSFAAIHTTTELTTQVMWDLVQHPELIDDLRQEMITVLRATGWKKTALYNMKLLDSVLKESLRVKPSSLCKIVVLLSCPSTMFHLGCLTLCAPSSVDAPHGN